MGYTGLYSAPYYTGTGSGVAIDVPHKWDVALGGRTYMIDRKVEEWGIRSIPLIRAQADDSVEPGESTVNPDDLWRRSQTSWHKGAGQTFLDRPESDRARFRSSKGIDVWDRWAMCRLPTTDNKRSSVETNLRVVPVGSRLYAIDGGGANVGLYYTTDITVGSPTWTTVTGTPAAAPTSLATDGFNVWSAHSASGIYLTTRTSGTTASHITGSVTLVAYAKGRLMAANANSIYNPTGAGALPAALFTQANTDFTWVGFAEGEVAIYAAGFSGDRSIIYRIPIKADGTGLDVPVAAGTLPDGEIVRSIEGYLGNLFIGTESGARFCIPDTSGNLQIGQLIETTSPVRCFEGQESFVWFGLSDYDSTSTGLGRIDLRTFIDSQMLLLAWASDLMAPGSDATDVASYPAGVQGEVLSVATFQGIRVFAVSGAGIWAESTTRVAEGQLDSGLLTFDLPDAKVAIGLDVRYDAWAFEGTHKSYLATDGSSTFTLVGTHLDTSNDNSGDTFALGEDRAEMFEIREHLSRDGVNTTKGPCLTRHTMRANPTTKTADVLLLPLILAQYVRVASGTDAYMDVAFERENIRDLRMTRQIVTYQEGDLTYPVFVQDYEWRAKKYSEDRSVVEGTLLVSAKTMPV